MSEIQNRIIELRKSMNLSQEEFGKRIGLSKSGISNIENGKREISNTHIKIISSVFNISEEWLKTGNDLSKLVKELEVFTEYLKSLGYHVQLKNESEDSFYAEIRGHELFFKLSQEEFEALQNKNKESLEAAILLQYHKSKNK